MTDPNITENGLHLHPTFTKRKRKREKEKSNKQSKVTYQQGNGPILQKAPQSKHDLPMQSSTLINRTSKRRFETLDKTISKMDPRLTVDHLSGQLHKLGIHLNSIESTDQSITEHAFVDVTSWSKPRVLSNLPSFLEYYCNSVKPQYSMLHASPAHGTPHTLIITSAARRATDLIRAVKQFQTKDVLIAKLFAKHIKLEHSISTCLNSSIGVGVGTPARVLDVIQNGALKSDALYRLILDMSAVNEKHQGLCDVKDTLISLFNLLNEPSIQCRLGNQLKILVY